MSPAFSNVMTSPPRLHCRHTRVSTETDEPLIAIRERLVGGLAGDFMVLVCDTKPCEAVPRSQQGESRARA